MSFFRSDGLTYSITVVWRIEEEKERGVKMEKTAK